MLFKIKNIYLSKDRKREKTNQDGGKMTTLAAFKFQD